MLLWLLIHLHPRLQRRSSLRSAPCATCSQQGAMSVSLSTAQILAAAKAKRQVAPAAAPATASSPSGAEEAAELAAYLQQRFTPDADALTGPLPQPLSHYQLTHRADGTPLPRAVFVVPDVVSSAEEAQLLSLVGASPAASWTTLKRRSLQMWGGFPPADPEAEFNPSALPAWQGQLIDRLVASGVAPAAPALRPNHVLLNRYAVGEGILAHQDGSLYAPQVAILSLGSHTVMDFFAALKDSLPESYKPAFSVFLPARSLLLFSEELYTTYFHAIAERSADRLDQPNLLGVPQQLLASGETNLERSTRISLTIRRVHTRDERIEAQRRAAASDLALALPIAAAAAAVPPASTAHRVPVVDIADLLEPRSGSEPSEGRRRVAREIYDACTSDGFFYISGHGVSVELQERLERLSRAFFDLPLETKMRISMEHGGLAWRGYFPCFGELTSGRPDIKEGLYLGTELPAEHPLVAKGTPLHGANQWPEELPELRSTILEYMNQLIALGHTLLEAVALGLGLDEQHFRRELTGDPTVLFRLFNYPEHEAAQKERPEASFGVGEHTDYGLLTILKQDNSGGLEVNSPAHGWIAAPPLPNTFVVNIGDMLERLTGGRFQSTPHRVRNLAPHARISAPLFFDPAWSARVQPLPLDHLPPTKNISDARKTRWDKSSVFDFEGTYGEYLLRKVGKVFPDLAAKKQIHSANEAASAAAAAPAP